MAEQVGRNVTIAVEPVDTDELNRRQQAAVGDAPVFDLTIKSGSKTITDLRTETVIFTTRHFSKYVIGYEAPAPDVPSFADVPANAYYADAVA